MASWPLASIYGWSSHHPLRVWEGGKGMLTQTKVDANGLQGGEGEQANPKGHEPVCKDSQVDNG